MRLSNRLFSNAATTYLRLGTTFVLGLFGTWYILGAVGILGFGVIGLAVSSTGPFLGLERALRFGLVRELAAAIASRRSEAVRCCLTSAFRLCAQVAIPLALVVSFLAAAAFLGFFSTPRDQPNLELALAVLILGEGVHAVARLLSAPYVQALFAGQWLALDNLLMALARATYVASALLVFGWWLTDADLATQLMGFAASRMTLQLSDVIVGIWLAKRRIPGLRLDASAYDETEYRTIRRTVWHSSQVTVLMNASPHFLGILINLFFGLAYNGIWQVVVQFAGFARMFAEGLMRGIGPLSTYLHEGGRRSAAVDLMVRSIRYQLAVILPAAVVLGLWSRPLLDLWVGSRLNADPGLLRAGISSAEGLDLAASMVCVLLVFQTLRAGFFGVERVLYGMGYVESYAWFSKWSALIVLISGAAAMGIVRHPLAAPFALLAGYLPYSPFVVVAAARRVAGMDVHTALRRSVRSAVLLNLAFLLLLLPIRRLLGDLDLPTLVGLLTGTGLLYAALALPLLPEADERRRLAEIWGQVRSRLRSLAK